VIGLVGEYGGRSWRVEGTMVQEPERGLSRTKVDPDQVT
jgi:hypothetical protein